MLHELNWSVHLGLNLVIKGYSLFWLKFLHIIYLLLKLSLHFIFIVVLHFYSQFERIVNMFYKSSDKTDKVRGKSECDVTEFKGRECMREWSAMWKSAENSRKIRGKFYTGINVYKYCWGSRQNSVYNRALNISPKNEGWVINGKI